jgi:hypothetical protein
MVSTPSADDLTGAFRDMNTQSTRANDATDRMRAGAYTRSFLSST